MDDLSNEEQVMYLFKEYQAVTGIRDILVLIRIRTSD